MPTTCKGGLSELSAAVAADPGGAPGEPTGEPLLDIRLRISGVLQPALAPARRLVSDFLRHELALIGDVQPDATGENAHLQRHSWGRVRRLAPRPDRRGHRRHQRGATPSWRAACAGGAPSALIACVCRAAEWRHKKIGLAGHALLHHLDAVSGHA